jgi:hypothetical protein
VVCVDAGATSKMMHPTRSDIININPTTRCRDFCWLIPLFPARPRLSYKDSCGAKPPHNPCWTKPSSTTLYQYLEFKAKHLLRSGGLLRTMLRMDAKSCDIIFVCQD